MLTIHDQAKQVAHSGPPPPSALGAPKGDHLGALDSNQEREIMAPRHSAGTSSKHIHDKIAQLYEG
jgi:hypothetical protein